MDRSKEEELEMVKQMLLLLLNKTREQYFSDPFTRIVIKEFSRFIVEFRHMTPEEFVKQWKENITKAEVELRKHSVMTNTCSSEHEESTRRDLEDKILYFQPLRKIYKQAEESSKDPEAS